MGTIKKRVKRRLPLVFIFLFLLVGIAIFMYPKVSNWLSVYTSRVEIGSYNNAVKEMDNSQIEALEKKANDYNEALAKKRYAITFSNKLRSTSNRHRRNRLCRYS